MRGEGGVNARKEEKVSGAFLVGVNGYREWCFSSGGVHLIWTDILTPFLCQGSVGLEMLSSHGLIFSSCPYPIPC